MPPPLVDLLGGSDLVAVGVVSEIRESTLVLTLETVVAGAENPSSIEIRRFKNWTCSSRWRPYEGGQRVIVFAQATKQGPGDFLLRSAGSEGEFPVVDHVVMVHGYPLAGLATKTLEGTLLPHPVPLKRFLGAVRGLRNCFLIESDDKNGTRVQQIYSDADLAELSESSEFHRHLVKTAQLFVASQAAKN